MVDLPERYRRCPATALHTTDWLVRHITNISGKKLFSIPTRQRHLLDLGPYLQPGFYVGKTNSRNPNEYVDQIYGAFPIREILRHVESRSALISKGETLYIHSVAQNEFQAVALMGSSKYFVKTSEACKVVQSLKLVPKRDEEGNICVGYNIFEETLDFIDRHLPDTPCPYPPEHRNPPWPPYSSYKEPNNPDSAHPDQERTTEVGVREDDVSNLDGQSC
eukprot:scaffold95756_cov43-Attheya_sp.AAC.2